MAKPKLGGTTMIIDVHSHLAESADYKSIEEVVESGVVDEVWLQGIEGIGWHDFTYAPQQEMLKAKKDFAPFFRAFAYLDFYSVPDEIKRLKDMGFEGLKSIRPGKPYNHPDWFPFYEVAEKEQMPILFHTGGVTNPPKPVDREFWKKYSPDASFMNPIYLDIIGKLFPDLVLIAAHFGGKVWRDEAMEVIYNHENVYADISGINPFYIEDLSECMNRCAYYDRSILISEKLLFAVDTTYGRGSIVEGIREMKMFWESFFAVYGSDKPWGRDKDKVMGETARKIFGC